MRAWIIAALVLLGANLAFAQGSTTLAPDASQPAQNAGAPANPPMVGPQLLISTDMGDMVLQLDSQHAPNSVADILRYVREKHYDGTVFYRVVKGFVIQMGSWEANIKARPVHSDPVPLEANNGLSNLRGTVALARGDDPNSAGAEFFINLTDNVGLDHSKDDPGNSTGYAVFGEVISGMDVADKISEVPVGDNGPMQGQAPVQPIVIKKVSVIANAP